MTLPVVFAGAVQVDVRDAVDWYERRQQEFGPGFIDDLDAGGVKAPDEGPQTSGLNAEGFVKRAQGKHPRARLAEW